MPGGDKRNGARVGLSVLALGLFLSGSMALPSRAASLEYPIKAAFLYKFAPFVQWPILPQGVFTICVAGKDPFGQDLDKGVKDAAIEGRSMRVQRLDTVDATTACQILYVTGTPVQSVQQALDMVRNLPVLTVTETPDMGSVIQFAVEKNRVRFDIDMDAAKSHGLTVSSKLLRLARNVRPKRE